MHQLHSCNALAEHRLHQLQVHQQGSTVLCQGASLLVVRMAVLGRQTAECGLVLCQGHNQTVLPAPGFNL